MYDIVIIGAGPAGLSAAIYGQRAGKETLLIDAKGFGGQIINTPDVENYPGIKSSLQISMSRRRNWALKLYMKKLSALKTLVNIKK